MKLNFYHDTKIKYSSVNKLYYNSGFNYGVWKRYLSIFNNIAVHSRLEQVKTSGRSNQESISSGPNVTFKPIKSFKGVESIVKLKSILNEINKSVDGERYFLLRVPSIIGAIAALTLIRKKKKYMVEVVGCSKDSFLYKGDLISKILAFPMYFIQKKVVKEATVANYITEEYLSSIYKSNGKEFKGIPNIYFDNNKDDFKKLKKMEIMLEPSPSQHTIGLIGSLEVNYKGHLTAFKTIKVLKDKGYDIQLKLVGPGNLEKWSKVINKLDIRDNIKLIGKLPSGEKIDEFLQSLDFYIQPSRTEGHGRALIEAVNNSCICFGTNIGGIPETLDSRYLIKKDDHIMLANMIIEHINSRNKKIENINANYKRIQKYDPVLIENKRKEALAFYVREVEKS